MRAHKLRVTQGSEHEITIRLRPRLLVLHRHETGVKQSSIQGTEMKFTDDQWLVTARIFEVGNAPAI